MVGFLVWATVGIILNVALASRKGYGIFGWLVLGAFFGFLSTLVLAVLPKNVDGKAFKKCPYCAETIKTEATVCRYCSKEVELKPLGSQETEETVHSEKQIESSIG